MELLNFLATIACADPDMATILKMVDKVMMIIYIAVPIIVVIYGAMDLLKAVVAQKDEEMKKGWQMLLKRVLYGVLIFLLGVIVSWAFKVFTGINTNCIGDIDGK